MSVFFLGKEVFQSMTEETNRYAPQFVVALPVDQLTPLSWFHDDLSVMIFEM